MPALDFLSPGLFQCEGKINPVLVKSLNFRPLLLVTELLLNLSRTLLALALAHYIF